MGQKIRFLINNETEQHEAIISQTGKSINFDKTYKVYNAFCAACLSGCGVDEWFQT
jgi:cobalt-zinc-cadmium efflux system membrane fusion protein